MVDCPDCNGAGYIVKKVPKRVWNGKAYGVGWVQERVNCSTCEGKGQVSFLAAEKIRLYAKERVMADKAETLAAYEAVLASLLPQKPKKEVS